MRLLVILGATAAAWAVVFAALYAFGLVAVGVAVIALCTIAIAYLLGSTREAGKRLDRAMRDVSAWSDAFAPANDEGRMTYDPHDSDAILIIGVLVVLALYALWGPA